MELKPLRSIVARKLYLLMTTKLRLEQLHIGLGNRGKIKSDKDLDALAPFTFKAYFSRDMKKRLLIRRDVMNTEPSLRLEHPAESNVLRIP